MDTDPSYSFSFEVVLPTLKLHCRVIKGRKMAVLHVLRCVWAPVIFGGT